MVTITMLLMYTALGRLYLFEPLHGPGMVEITAYAQERYVSGWNSARIS